MLDKIPGKPLIAHDSLIECIEACLDCAQSCDACADACISEKDIDALRRCIRLDLDCADVCVTTARMLSRQQNAEPGLVRAQLEACALACQVCGDECTKQQHHEHCRVCADACRVCAKACQDAIGALGKSSKSAKA
jgi:hypothetical protein